MHGQARTATHQQKQTSFLAGTIRKVEDTVSDQQLKGLMEQLGDAVHRTLSDSNTMADVLDDIKQAGYSVSLSVDATFSEPSGEADFQEAPVAAETPIPHTTRDGLPLTDNDESFLRALRIAY